MKVKGKPFLSIITVTFNSESYLEQTINSVISQDQSNSIEYIIIDGGSTDNTLQIISSYNSKINWISESDNGIYDAINKGIKISRGNYIGIINSDDWYEPNILSEIIHLLEQKNIDVLCGLIRVWENESILGIQGNSSNFLKYGMIAHPSCFVRKSVYEELGLYEISLKISADYDFMLRCFNANKSFYLLEKVIANFRLGGVSNKFSSARIIETNKIQYQNRLISITRYLVVYLKVKLKSIIS